MERFYRNVRAMKRPLQQTPEILHAIRVNLAVHIGYGVVNDFMLKLR